MNSTKLKEFMQTAQHVETERVSPQSFRLSEPGLSDGFDSWMRIPLIRALQRGHWHQWNIYGPIQIKNLLDQFPDSIIQTRSYDDFGEDDPESEITQWAYLRLDEDCWISAGQHQLLVYARDRDTARDVAQGLWFLFRQQNQVRPPEYHLVKQSSCGVDSENILLTTIPQQEEADDLLFYGEDFHSWHTELVEAFSERHTGITLLEGPPGTGKTSYIRRLMVELKDSHRFYFVPSSNLGVLKDAEFVDFWSEQRRSNPNRQMVVILEDAEEALLPRTTSNRAEVSVLLNITDGLLGEFLRLHILCTVNCPVEHLDPALLRPGRLISSRHFGNIPRVRAMQIAKKLQKSLPLGEEFSLAEIINGTSNTPPLTNRTVGFAV